MSAEHHRPPSDTRIRPTLADLGINVGRMRREDPVSFIEPRAHRVLIDVQPDGAFTVYCDADVQVLCRCAHLPDDHLVEVRTRPIPEAWLDEPIGHSGDGSVADLLAEVVADWPDLR